MRRHWRTYRDFFDLFEDFRGYTNFFLLNDLVDDDSGDVRFMLDFDDFRSSDPRPRSTTDYLRWRSASLAFLAARSARITAYVQTLQGDFEEVHFERSRRPRLTFGPDALDAAMNAFGVPTGNRSAIRDFVATRSYAEFYIPPSRAYLGLQHADSRRSDAVHVGYVDYWTDDGIREWFALPVNRFDT